MNNKRCNHPDCKYLALPPAPTPMRYRRQKQRVQRAVWLAPLGFCVTSLAASRRHRRWWRPLHATACSQPFGHSGPAAGAGTQTVPPAAAASATGPGPQGAAPPGPPVVCAAPAAPCLAHAGPTARPGVRGVAPFLCASYPPRMPTCACLCTQVCLLVCVCVCVCVCVREREGGEGAKRKERKDQNSEGSGVGCNYFWGRICTIPLHDKIFHVFPIGRNIPCD